MKMSSPLLEFKNVTKEFKMGGGLGLISRRIKAIDSISFKIPSDKPTITSIVGESGSGKSTIAKLALGLLSPTSGEILYKGEKIEVWLKKKRMKFLREVQPIFQDPYSVYNPFYRIDRVLEIVVKKFKLASNKDEARRLIHKCMRDIGLRSDLLGRYPYQLSGGERQRFLLARILLIKPKLIVADEPISMIDASLKAIFLDHIKRFRDEYGVSCIYVTHDLNTASYIADNILVLCNGRIVEEGPAGELIDNPLHPYTKLLVDSIAIPDPDSRWQDKLDLTVGGSLRKLRTENCCVFSAKCPYASEDCKRKIPPTINVKSGRKVSCFLYASKNIESANPNSERGNKNIHYKDNY